MSAIQKKQKDIYTSANRRLWGFMVIDCHSHLVPLKQWSVERSCYTKIKKKAFHTHTTHPSDRSQEITALAGDDERVLKYLWKVC